MQQRALITRAFLRRVAGHWGIFGTKLSYVSTAGVRLHACPCVALQRAKERAADVRSRTVAHWSI